MMIKVCGMRTPENIRDVAALTPMLMGFIFWDGSPRYAGDLDPDILKELPGFVHPVALFVDATEDQILAITGRYGIKIVQLHGNETPRLCDSLKQKELKVLKALSISSADDVARAAAYAGCVDMFVFDTRSEVVGGSGKKFDWTLLNGYDLDIPYLLSGGIGPDDVDNIVAAMRPHMAGIDINSRFETTPGHKDLLRLARFILSLRQLNEDDDQPTELPF